MKKKNPASKKYYIIQIKGRASCQKISVAKQRLGGSIPICNGHLNLSFLNLSLAVNVDRLIFPSNSSGIKCTRQPVNTFSITLDRLLIFMEVSHDNDLGHCRIHGRFTSYLKCMFPAEIIRTF